MLVELKTPEIGNHYLSRNKKEEMILVKENTLHLGDMNNLNPLLHIPYYELVDLKGIHWFVRKVSFWNDFEEMKKL